MTKQAKQSSQVTAKPLARRHADHKREFGWGTDAALHSAPELQLAGNQAVQELLRTGIIRAKLSVSQPDDPDEREADAMADHIMRSSSANFAAATPCGCVAGGELCDECRTNRPTISRQSANGTPTTTSSRVLNAALLSQGRPLDASVRAFFEPRFGRDFGHVRIHTGQESARASASISANAFATGNDIFFGPGKYAPESEQGKRLLAHELTHTLQRPSGSLFGASVFATASHRLKRQDGAGRGAGADPEDPDAGRSGAELANNSEETFAFEGMELSADARKTREELEDYLGNHGLDAFENLMAAFEDQLKDRRYRNSQEFLSDVSGVPDWIELNQRQLARMENVQWSFEEGWTTLRRQANEFLAVFDVQAHLVLNQMLQASEQRILSERQRYGLTQDVTIRNELHVSEDGMLVPDPRITSHSDMSNTQGTQGLGKAAASLIAKAKVVLARMEDRADHQPWLNLSGQVSDQQQATYEADSKKVDDALRDYNVLRFQSDNDYPILASYSPLDITGTHYVHVTIDRLEQIAKGPSQDLARTLYDETLDRLTDIEKVYMYIQDGDLKIWKLAPVISLTRQQIALLPAAVQDKLIDDKVDAAESEGSLLNKALAVLAIALGALAAIPTGGSSLAAGVAFAAGVGSAVIGGYFALEHIQNYAIEAAANGTDFDKARAVSQVEPSLFWLAIDIVGAIADIHAAASAFEVLSASLREASELRKVAQGGQRVAEADEAMRRLAEDGDKYAPGLGRKLTQAAEAGEQIEKEAGIAAWEGTLSPETKAYLVDNPEIRAIYNDMDEDLRWLCTHCSENCLIQGITRSQVSRIKTVMGRLDPDELEALRIYLHINKETIEPAIVNLERVANDEGMRTLLERSLTEKANPPTAPLLSGGAATAARNAAGAAAGGEFLPIAGENWLRSTGGSAGMVPGQIAARLRGRTFADFDSFQQAFWKEIANDPELAAGFGEANRTIMAAGDAPFAPQDLMWGRSAGGRYTLHHIVPIEHGGGVYDMSNLLVASPELHFGVIHSPTVPPTQSFKQLPLDK